MEIDLPESFSISNEMANIITAVEGGSTHRKWLKDSPEDYGMQTRKRLLSGSGISASDYLEALKFYPLNQSPSWLLLYFFYQ